MTGGLRIGRISVEGFKGFTETKEIDIRNRHMFLIGPNGNGKSSIIEAIRWGLFGSSNRPNDIVRNQGYGGDCRVEMDLERNGKKWCLRRILTPGAARSRAALFDEDGVEHSMNDVLPQMDSLDAGEGTHIIFNAQSAPLRRRPEDLSPFENTVFDHLGLKHPRAMLSHLETFLREQEDEENSLDRLVSAARTQIESRIDELERHRGRILNNPPWSGELQPSRQDTESKAHNLIRQIATTEPGQDVSRFSLAALVDAADRALADRIDQHRGPLEGELEQLNDKLSRLDPMRDAFKSIANKRASLREARQKLRESLDGTSLATLHERVLKERHEAETRDLVRRLGETAAELVDRTECDGWTPCPLCGEKHDHTEFERTISEMVNASDEASVSSLRVAEDRWAAVQQIDRNVQGLHDDVVRLQADLEAAIAAEDDDELTSAFEDDRFLRHIESIHERQSSLSEQIVGLDDWLVDVQAALQQLHEEADYQQLQRNLIDAKAVRADLRLVQQVFEQFVAFGESARDIHDAIRSTLTETLREKAPDVAKDLTSVFNALTRHPHFDRLVIDEKKLPKLELRVASSTDPSRQPHPTGVLNGQAQSALALVPYFAQSRATKAPTEVYVVLLDDPTRAFDRQHIQILIEQLADLGKRVQVIVATQETELFLNLLPENFTRESYVIVEPVSWSYEGGPRLRADA